MLWYWFVLGMWMLWLLVYWRGGLDILQDIRASSSHVDRLYLIILTGVTAGIVVDSFWAIWQEQPVHAFVPLGAGLVVLGICGTFYCRWYLGKYWTAENKLQANHQIVDAGPYACVRHPIYTAAITLYLGTGLVFTMWWNVLLVTLAIAVYVLKTANEDRFLSANLSDYPLYKQRVPHRLVPNVW